MSQRNSSHSPAAATRPRALLGVLALGGAFLLFASAGRADAPAGRYTIASGTVTDTKTGLIWQQSVPTDLKLGVDAYAYCDALTLGGSSEWRTPGVRELSTLVDETRTLPAIDTTAFPNTPVGGYWTFTAEPNSPTASYWIDFSYGTTAGGNTTHTSALVRCVR